MKNKLYLLLVLFSCLLISCKKDKDNDNNNKTNQCDTLLMIANKNVQIDSSKVFDNSCFDLIINVEPQSYLLLDTIEVIYLNLPDNITLDKKYNESRITIEIQNNSLEFDLNWSTGETSNIITITEPGEYWYSLCYGDPELCTQDTIVIN